MPANARASGPASGNDNAVDDVRDLQKPPRVRPDETGRLPGDRRDAFLPERNAEVSLDTGSDSGVEDNHLPLFEDIEGLNGEAVDNEGSPLTRQLDSPDDRFRDDGFDENVR